MKKRLIKVLSIFAVAAALTAACSGGGNTGSGTSKESLQNGSAKGEESSDSGKNGAASGGESVFTYIVQGDTGNSFNPMTADDRWGLMLAHAVYAPAYHIYSDGTYDYILAQSMEASEDGLSYTMKLKDGLKWSDGQPLTADDIVFTYEKINESTQNLYVGDKPIKVEKQDDTTVIFKLPAVSASAAEMLSDEVSILPKHIFEGRASFDVNLIEEKPVGAGPYVFEEYKTGEYIKFKKNPYYVKGEAAIDTIIYRNIEQSDTANLTMQAGEADAMIVPPDLLEPYIDNEAFEIHNYSEGRVPYIRLNSASEKMKDKKYREGVLYALDRDEILLAAYTDRKFYELGYSFLPFDNKYYTDKVQKWEHDVEKSKELTKDGAKNLKLCYISEDSMHERMALTIQSELKEAGIQVELSGVNTPAYMKLTNDNTVTDYDMFIGGYVMGSDPDTFAMLFSSKKDNRLNFHNEEIDRLFEEGNATLDESKRKEIYDKVQKLVSEEAIYYPLGTNLRTLVTSKRLDGVDEAKLVPIYTFGDLSKLKFK